MNARLYKSFSELKSKCVTSEQRRAYNSLIRLFSENSVEFNDCTYKIALAWDNLYSRLRCRKSLYGHGGDTCYMYLKGKDSKGKDKILVRVLDWNDIVVFSPADNSKGSRFRGNVKDIFSTYQNLYLFPNLYTEPSLYKKLGNCYLTNIIGHYINYNDSFNVIVKQVITKHEKIVDTINNIAQNPKQVHIEEEIVDRNNYPEVYKFFDELLDKVDLLNSKSSEEFASKLQEINDYLKTFDNYKGKTPRGYIECIIPNLDGYDWRIDIGEKTIEIKPNDPTISMYHNELGAEFYDFRDKINISGDYPDAKRSAKMKKTFIPFKR